MKLTFNSTLTIILLVVFGSQLSQAQTWRTNGNAGCASCVLGTNDANDIDFVTDGVVRATIQPTSGNMGIGTTVPSLKLHVAGGTDAELASGGFLLLGSTSGTNIVSDDNEIMARNNGAASTLFLQNEGGDLNISQQALFVAGSTNFVGVGTAAPAVELHVNHAVGSAAANGLRIQNTGANGNYWSLYTENGSGNLSLNFKGTTKGNFNDASGAYTALSDQRYKKDIEKASPLMDKVMKLDVKKYHFLENESSDMKYYGMLAQEVDKIFPEVVYYNILDDGTDLYTMDYSAFGVIAIKAIQEQQVVIEEKNKQVSELQAQLNQLQAVLIEKGVLSSDEAVSKSSTISLSSARLEQNAPNPFSSSTTIKYFIPENTSSSLISFIDENGKNLKTVKLSGTGAGQIVLNAFELPAGTYTYLLTVDGRTIETKQMLLTK